MWRHIIALDIIYIIFKICETWFQVWIVQHKEIHFNMIAIYHLDHYEQNAFDFEITIVESPNLRLVLSSLANYINNKSVLTLNTKLIFA